MQDAQGWYVLANAHLTNFWKNQESPEELQRSIKAFAMSEKLQKMPNPDLHYNRAIVLEYLERYGEAVAEYQRAHAIDPFLQAD
jgi:tetratricopeptide (TPR) repeat protein